MSRSFPRPEGELRAAVVAWPTSLLVQATACSMLAASNPYNWGPLHLTWPTLGVLNRAEFPIVMDMAAAELNQRIPTPSVEGS